MEILKLRSLFLEGGCSLTISRMHTALLFWVRIPPFGWYLKWLVNIKSTDHVMTKKTCDHKLLQSLLYHFWKISCLSTTLFSMNILCQQLNFLKLPRLRGRAAAHTGTSLDSGFFSGIVGSNTGNFGNSMQQFL